MRNCCFCESSSRTGNDSVNSSVAPTLAHMNHIPEVKEIVSKGLQIAKEDKDFGHQSNAITQELQHALREAYTKNKEDLLEERRILTAGRFEREERLDQLKHIEDNTSSNGDSTNNNDPDAESVIDPADRLWNDHKHSREDDEPFESAYQLAQGACVV